MDSLSLSLSLCFHSLTTSFASTHLRPQHTIESKFEVAVKRSRELDLSLTFESNAVGAAFLGLELTGVQGYIHHTARQTFENVYHPSIPDLLAEYAPPPSHCHLHRSWPALPVTSYTAMR
jgi:hypothetical protein